MTRFFIPTVGSSATSANRRHLRLPLQAAPGAARGIVTSSRTTSSKPPSKPFRPRFASASGGKADGELALFPIAAQGSGRVGSLRGFLPRALSNACPHASSCTHGLRTRAGIEQRLTGPASCDQHIQQVLCDATIDGARPIASLPNEQNGAAQRGHEARPVPEYCSAITGIYI